VPRELHDVSCVVHLHSTYSDGTGTVPEIGRAGERAEVDVVLLTDHDSLDAARQGDEGWYGRTLVLAGHEVSPIGRNHLLVFGVDEEIDWRGRTPAQIAQAAREAGGFGFAAHPFSTGSQRFRRVSSLGVSMEWEDLDCLDGIEVWSFLADNGQRLASVREAARFIARPERYVTLAPRENLDRWDRLAARRRVVGIGGLDAHQFGFRIAGRVVRLMGYARSFRQLRTHALLREGFDGSLEHDRALVFEALREGRCYIAAHSVAPASGFRFFGESDGGGLVQMGSEADASGGGWVLRAALPRAADVRLLRDGAEVARAREARSLEWRAEGPGVYRVEATLVTHGAERTWVLSNPVYLR
jgi:hypothetical protein